MLEEMVNDNAVVDKVWTTVFKKPFVKRCMDIFARWNIPANSDVRQVPLLSFPPWVDPPLQLKEDLSHPLHNALSKEQIKAVALDTINSKYPIHFKMYTDGSKVANSTTAGLWIPSLGVEEMWKLAQGESRSIMGAELFAINQALHWLLLNQPLIANEDVVILSDSKSGIMALGNHQTRSYSSASNQILRLADILNDILSSLTVQWVLSHMGLSGNEKADELAREAHNLTVVTEAPLDMMEIKMNLKATLKSRCQLRYDLVKQNTHMGSIKSNIEPWSWTKMKSRRSETAMARLRIGHTRLKAHLFRFGLATNPDCSLCGTPEDTPQIQGSQKYTTPKTERHGDSGSLHKDFTLGRRL